MKKILCLICCTLGLNIYCFAQKNNISLGFSYGFGKSNIQNHSVLDKRYNPLKSSSISFDFSYRFNKSLSLSTQIMIDQRGGKFTSYESEILSEPPNFYMGDTINRLNKNEFAYFTFPLKLNYYLNLNKKMSLEIGFGGFYSYLVKQVWNYELLDVAALIEPGTLQFRYKENDFGIITSLGVNYKLSSITSLKLSFNYLRGFTTMFEDNGLIDNIYDENEEIKAYHQRVYIEIGAFFLLKGIKKR